MVAIPALPITLDIDEALVSTFVFPVCIFVASIPVKFDPSPVYEVAATLPVTDTPPLSVTNF